MKFIVLKLIRIYQAFSRGAASTPFLLGAFSGCRSWPTCSDFAYHAVSTQGVMVGGAAALKRVLNCRPQSVILSTRP